MTTGDVVYSLRFSLIKILPEPGFDLGSTAGESCVLTARLHMLYNVSITYRKCPQRQTGETSTTCFNETKSGPSTSKSCDKRKTQLVRTNYFTTLCRNIITNLYCHITKYIKIKQISIKQLTLSTNNYNLNS